MHSNKKQNKPKKKTPKKSFALLSRKKKTKGNLLIKPSPMSRVSICLFIERCRLIFVTTAE